MLSHICQGNTHCTQQEGEIPSWRRRGGGWRRRWRVDGAMQRSDPSRVEQDMLRFWSRWNYQTRSWCTPWASTARREHTNNKLSFSHDSHNAAVCTSHPGLNEEKIRIAPQSKGKTRKLFLKITTFLNIYCRNLELKRGLKLWKKQLYEYESYEQLNI